jgi:hypothetical protein
VRDPLKFQKRRQLFIRVHNETLSAAAMGVNHEETLLSTIDQQNELLE